MGFGVDDEVMRESTRRYFKHAPMAGPFITPVEARIRLECSSDGLKKLVPRCIRIGKRTVRYSVPDVMVAKHGAAIPVWEGLVRSPALREKMGLVYAIETRGAESPEGRLASLQTGCPHDLTIVVALPGSMATEAALHMRFANQRVSSGREWFHKDEDVSAFLAATTHAGHWA